MSSEDNKSNEPREPQPAAVVEVEDVAEDAEQPQRAPSIEESLRARIVDLTEQVRQRRQIHGEEVSSLSRELSATRVVNERLREEIVLTQGTARAAAILTAAVKPAANRLTATPASPTITFNSRPANMSLVATPANIFASPNITRAARVTTAPTMTASTTTVSTTRITLKDYPTYSGNASEGNTIRRFALLWLNIATTQGVSLADDTDTSGQVALAATRLTDAALDWYHDIWTPLVEAMAPSKPKWSELITALQAQFEPLPPSFIARSELKALRQTGTLADYINRFRHLNSSIPDMAEADRVDNFIRGLKPALQTKVNMSLPENLITATTVAVRQEAAYQAMAPTVRSRPAQSNQPFRPRPAPTSNDVGHLAALEGEAEDEKEHTSLSLATMQTPSPKLTDEVRAELMRSGKCFRCRQVGHMSKNCPKNSKN
jgi:hypothetical protein